MDYIDNEQKHSKTDADAKRERERLSSIYLVISINKHNSNFFILWHNIALGDSDCKEYSCINNPALSMDTLKHV